MELSKGVCFCCDSDKVIEDFQHKKVHKIISSLFTNDLLNVEELDRVLSYLEICPFCYHKLLILGRTNENLTSGISSGQNRKCVMCRGGDVLFHIAKWPHFKTISRDMDFKHEPKFAMCSDCLFYLDLRYTFKETILNKYPELKPKLKLKIQNIVPSPSILKVENGKSTKKYKRLRFSDVDESIESPITTPVIDFSAIQVFKPLKYYRSIKKSNINKDPKFINQIPYVLLEVTNLRPNRENVISKYLKENDLEEEVITTSSPTKGLKIKFKTKRKKLRTQLSKESTEVDLKPASLETILQKYDFKKDLIINLSKMPHANNKYMKDNTLLKDSKNSNNPTDNCQLVSDQNAKNRLSECSDDEEDSKNTDTTTDVIESESDQLNLSSKRKRYRPKPLSKQKNITVDISDKSIETENDERCGDLEKSNFDEPDELRSTVDPDGNNHRDTNDKSANIESNNENSSINSAEKTEGKSSQNIEDKNDNSNNDNKGIKKLRSKKRKRVYAEEEGNNCRDSKDDSKNSEGKDKKDSANYDEETVDSSSENIENKNGNLDDNKGIKKLRIKRRQSSYVEKENEDQSKSDRTSEDACVNEATAEISTEKNVDNTDVEDVEDNGEDVEEDAKDVEENMTDVEDNVKDVEENVKDVEENVKDVDENVEDVDENVEDVDENVEEIEENAEDIEENAEDIEENAEDIEENVEDVQDDNPRGDEKVADLNSDEAEIGGDESDGENTEKEEIDNEKLIEEENNSASNIAQEETMDTKTNTNDVVDDSSDETKLSTVDKDNIKDILSFLEDSVEKTLNKEEKSNIDTFEDKDEDSNSSASKRKCDDDDEINTNDSTEKKKKKVTFSEDV